MKSKDQVTELEKVEQGKDLGVITDKELTFRDHLPTLEYRRERADLIQVYKIIHEIDNIDKEKLFTSAQYTATRGHSHKLHK